MGAFTSPSYVCWDEVEAGSAHALSKYWPFTFKPDSTDEFWTSYSTNIASCHALN